MGLGADWDARARFERRGRAERGRATFQSDLGEADVPFRWTSCARQRATPDRLGGGLQGLGPPFPISVFCSSAFNALARWRSGLASLDRPCSS